MMATVPFTYECSKDAGFVLDPNTRRRFGYVSALKFGGTAFGDDLQVAVAFNDGKTPTALTTTGPTAPGQPLTAKVVGVIETFGWNGGVGDTVRLEFYVSQENAARLKAFQQQAAPTTTKVESLAWWIADYDQESKRWFEQAYPLGGAVSGLVAGKDNPELDVDLSPVVVKEGIDVNVYKVTIGVAPAANTQYRLHFANSSSTAVVKPWGLVVGALA
jgi:hypothetical protein